MARDLKGKCCRFDPGSRQLLGERGSALSLTLAELYGVLIPNSGGQTFPHCALSIRNITSYHIKPHSYDVILCVIEYYCCRCEEVGEV